MKCEKCGGSGVTNLYGEDECSACAGTGQVLSEKTDRVTQFKKLFPDYDWERWNADEEKHLALSAQSWGVSCKYVPGRHGGYDNWIKCQSWNLAEVTCRDCLDAVVLNGEAAVARIIDLDAAAGEVEL